MADLYDIDRHTKPATDTKVREFLGRGGYMGGRYPILCRITVVNGGDSYDCIECDSDGNDIAGRTHATVINRAVTAAALFVNNKLPLYFCIEDNDFFFGEAL